MLFEKKETKIEHLVSGNHLSDCVGEKKIKLNPKAIITIKLFFLKDN